MAGSAWSVEETRVLLNLWGDERVQRDLDGATRNRTIFERIQREHTRMGYQRMWQQCRVKLSEEFNSHIQEDKG